MNDNIKGGALMALGMVCITINDVFMRFVLEELPIFQTMFLRGLIMIPMMFAYLWAVDGFGFRLGRGDWVRVIGRSVLELGAAIVFFSALKLMPFANLAALMQAVPLVVTVGAALILGQSFGWRRLVAILIGLVGVLIIIRPGPSGFEAGVGMAAITVTIVSIRDLITRTFSANVPSGLAALTTAMAVGLGGGVASLSQDWEPVSSNHMWLLLCASIFAAVAYTAMVASVRVGEMSFVAPFRYTALVAAVILGMVAFGEQPDIWVYIGAALVMGTGLFTMYRERQASGA